MSLKTTSTTTTADMKTNLNLSHPDTHASTILALVTHPIYTFFINKCMSVFMLWVADRKLNKCLKSHHLGATEKGFDSWPEKEPTNNPTPLHRVSHRDLQDCRKDHRSGSGLVQRQEVGRENYHRLFTPWTWLMWTPPVWQGQAHHFGPKQAEKVFHSSGHPCHHTLAHSAVKIKNIKRHNLIKLCFYFEMCVPQLCGLDTD